MYQVKNNETQEIKEFRTLREAVNFQELLVYTYGIDAEVL